ncbi:xanthine dehydrogenase family protein molybdopterin-binding subunit, partial [Alphaproteobacteria bacterium]|nr:xanthine dehydrogenase family protein molybdopterin-binding subunit [Alphaproteobacteria bacterium]
TYVGESYPRLEDEVLLTGGASFVDDLQLDGMLHAAFVRSTVAHARIKSIVVAAARAVPGVRAVYTIDDLMPVLSQDRVPENFPNPGDRTDVGPYVLARDEVCYVGETVALVIAENRYIAEDAAQLVLVDYDELPVMCDPRDSAAPGAPAVDTRQDRPNNLEASFTKEHGDCAAAFASAAHVVKVDLTQHRGVSMSMECRGSIVKFDTLKNRFMMWSSCQAPHSHRSILVYLLGLDEGQVRVIVPSVGGGFGPKLLFYPEDAAISAATMLLGRPIKWIEDRREHLMTTTQERDQHWEVEMAAGSDGKILGLRGRLYHDQGAYTARGTNIPHSSATSILGPYIVPTYLMEVIVAHTNKVCATSMRGAGHPQGCFAMERLLDRVADATGLDRTIVRERNIIPFDAMPYTQIVKTQAGQPITYDSGNFIACQKELLSAIDHLGFAARQQAARAEGRYLGFGMANYVKPTGRGPFETGLVRIGTSGKVSVYTGAVAMGQGFRTAMSQIVADQLGVKPSDVIIVAGDSDQVSLGFGGFASRQTVTAGSSIHLASIQVRKKLLAIAGHLLETSAEDLELIDGHVFVKGVPGMSIGFTEIANAVAGTPGYALPDGISAGLEAEVNFQPDNVTYANGAHGVELEVDPDTGGVKIQRYIIVHDSGRLVNPMIVDGQVYGAVTLGVGHALFEWMMYDEAGQPQTTNLAEYLLPTAPEIPNFEIIHQVSPTDRNPIGVKGVGECGVMTVAPAVLSAIESALAPFGVRANRYPITPAMLVEQIVTCGAA